MLMQTLEICFGKPPPSTETGSSGDCGSGIIHSASPVIVLALVIVDRYRPSERPLARRLLRGVARGVVRGVVANSGPTPRILSRIL